MTRGGGAAEEAAADGGVGKVAADRLRGRNAAVVVGGCAVRGLCKEKFSTPRESQSISLKRTSEQETLKRQTG